MRIISGIAKGRRLTSPASSKTRAVLDQVKESIFNILFDVRGAHVLDLFAGTGSIGLEAISRGAASAIFVDNDRGAVSVIKDNIKKCRFENESLIIPMSVDIAIKQLGNKEEQFDLIFVDPPYLKDLVISTIRNITAARLLKDDGLIITEHHPKEPIIDLPAGLKISDERKYGQTLVTFIEKLPSL